MVSSTRQALACIFAIFSVALVAHAQITPAKESGATITGKVTIKQKGLPGVTVVLRPNERRSSGREYSGPKGVTDEDGNYRILNVPPGSYRAVTVARTFVPAADTDREKLLIVNKSETIEHVDFAMLRGGVITGRVVDSDGRPVVEESVYLTSGPENANVYQQFYSMTDDRGVYRIYGVPPGSYKVAAGRGEESFQGGLPRPYRRTFHPSASDPLEAIVIEVTEGSEAKDVDITFTRRVTTYTASGRIVDSQTGQPVPNVSYGITRYEERGSSSMSGGTVTNSRGEFKLPNLAPGKYSVSIGYNQEDNLRFDEPKFEITDHDVTDLVVKATKGGSISGVVVFEGLDDKAAREQLGSAWVSVATEGQTRGASARVAEDGSFNLRGVGAGTASFYLYANPNGNVRVERVERDGVLIPSRNVTINDREQIKGIRLVALLGNATLRGQIAVENGAIPADGHFYIWARRVGDDPAILNSGSNLRSQVDARGQFVLEGLLPGTYEIDAGLYVSSAKVRYAAKNQQVVATAGTVTNVNVTVDLNSTPVKGP